MSWPSIRGRFLFREVNERGFDLPLGSVTKDGGVEFRSDLDISVWNPGDDTSSYKRVQPGDFVIGLRSFQSGIGRSQIETLVSPAYTVLRPVSSTVHVPFFKHLFKSDLYISRLENVAQGIRQGRTISTEDFYGIECVVPPPHEQLAIADYLDAETARIDALIAKKQQLIHLLEERVNSEIRLAVGLSSLASDRGHSSVELRRLVERRIEWASAGEMMTAFRDGQVTTRSSRGREGFTDSWTDDSKVKRVELGDVVVHGLDGFAGAIGDAETVGVCSPVYHVLRPLEGDSAYLGRLLRLLALEGYLGNFAVSTRERAVDFRNWDLFGRIPVPQVSIAQQRSIGNRIRAVRPLRELVEKSALLAQERKQALITAAVTGEFRVPGVA